MNAIELPVIARQATRVRPGVVVSTVTDRECSETCAIYSPSVTTDRRIRIARTRGLASEARTRHAAMVAVA